MLFSIGNFINAYGYFLESDIIGSDIEALYERMADLDNYEKRWLRSFLIWNKKNLENSGAKFYNNFLETKIGKLNMPV